MTGAKAREFRAIKPREVTVDELEGSLHTLWLKLNEAEHFLSQSNGAPEMQRQAVFGALSAMHEFVDDLVLKEDGNTHFTVDRLILTALIDIQKGAGLPAFLDPIQVSANGGTLPATGKASRIRASAVAAYTALTRAGHKRGRASDMVAKAFTGAGQHNYLPQSKSGISGRAVRAWANDPRYGNRTKPSLRQIIDTPTDKPGAEQFLRKLAVYLSEDQSFAATVKKDT